MSKTAKTLLLLAVIVTSPSAALAFGGIGCADLPEYDRATGALEGMPGACDMMVEQARRIIAEHDGRNTVAPLTDPVPRRRRRHHPARSPYN